MRLNPYIGEVKAEKRLSKKHRLIVLQINTKCELCKKSYAIEVHHKDKNECNNVFSNLMAVCHRCHHKLHKGTPKRTSKIIRMFGMTVNQLSKKYKLHPTTIYDRVRENIPLNVRRYKRTSVNLEQSTV